MNWILWGSQVLPWVQHEGTSLALLLDQHWDSPSFSVCKSQLTIQPNHDVTCAGAVTKTHPALLCWKSPHQTLFTALFPIYHEGFAAFSASGNLSPQTRLPFLTENGATANFVCDQFCSPQDMTSPFSQTPINAFSLWLASTFYLTLMYLCSQIPGSVLALFREVRSALLRRMFLKSEAISLNKFSPCVFADPFPCQKLTCSGTLGLAQPVPISIRLFPLLLSPSPWWALSPLDLLPAITRRWGVPGDPGVGLCWLWRCSLLTSAYPMGSDQGNSWYVCNFECGCSELCCMKPYNGF